MQTDALGKLTLRLTLGVLMLLHGWAKLASHPKSVEFIGGKLQGLGLPDLLAYGVYVGEVLAPLMIIFGIFARIGGLMIAVNMLFAIGLVHMADLTMLTSQGGWALELQGFYLFCGVAVMLMGSGRIAVKPD